jgi:hypothetical protein
MNKHLFTLVLSLAMMTGLCGVFSLSESPTGHIYTPTYDLCEEGYMEKNASNYVEVEMLSGVLTSEIVFSPLDNTGIPVKFWRSYSTDVDYNVWFDGVQIVINGSFNASTTNSLMIQSPSITYGIHTIKLEVSYLYYAHYQEREYTITFVESQMLV